MKKIVVGGIILLGLIIGAIYYVEDKVANTENSGENSNDQKLVPPSVNVR